MFRVKDLYEKYGHQLSLELFEGENGLHRRITETEIHNPGLGLSGFFKNYPQKRIHILDKMEMNYLNELNSTTRLERLEALFKYSIPAFIITRGYRPQKELVLLCKNQGVPLFRTHLSTTSLIHRLTYLLSDELAPYTSYHGTLVEIIDTGVLLQGESSVGKSEAALGLIERGHRLISDDIVKIKKRWDGCLEGTISDHVPFQMEIRGIGIINIANLYGASRVAIQKKIDFVVFLENWNKDCFYDRTGLEERFTTLMDVKLPYWVLPVKSTRDITLLLETLAHNFRLRKLGYHSAQEFTEKVRELRIKNALKDRK